MDVSERYREAARRMIQNDPNRVCRLGDVDLYADVKVMNIQERDDLGEYGLVQVTLTVPASEAAKVQP